MNKIEMYSKTGVSNLFNRLGILTKNKGAELKHLNSQKVDAFSDRQLAKALIEMENRKSQALEYLCRFQNR